MLFPTCKQDVRMKLIRRKINSKKAISNLTVILTLDRKYSAGETPVKMLPDYNYNISVLG